jgi:hypothetical protein
VKGGAATHISIDIYIYKSSSSSSSSSRHTTVDVGGEKIDGFV